MISNPTSFDIALVIGRFQPFHQGHRCLVEQARALAPRIALVLGSFRTSPSLRNPWSCAEREAIIRAELDFEPDFIYIEDSPYNPTQWYGELQRLIAQRYGSQARIIVLGHDKDYSSRYLHHIPQWETRLLPLFAEGIAASDLRTMLFQHNIAGLEKHCGAAATAYMLTWLKGPTGQLLAEEYESVQKYRASWSLAPYPPVFVTADALLIHQGHVLLIQRKTFPGKGQWAIPGGFLEQGETLHSAALRELQEETGLDLAHIPLEDGSLAPQVFDEPGRDPRGRMLTHVFHFTLAPRYTLPQVKGNDDAGDARWISLGSIDGMRDQLFADHWKIITFYVNRLT